jgi:hypothetical protein
MISNSVKPLRGNECLSDNADVPGCGDFKRNRYIVVFDCYIGGA